MRPIATAKEGAFIEHSLFQKAHKITCFGIKNIELEDLTMQSSTMKANVLTDKCEN